MKRKACLSGIGDEYGNGNNGICGGAEGKIIAEGMTLPCRIRPLRRMGNGRLLLGGLGTDDGYAGNRRKGFDYLS